jgi:uncharacterized protein (TIGR03546 family)
MMDFLHNIWQAFKGSLRGFDSSKQLALGVMLGLMIGLIPKDSLLVYLIAAMAILTNANLFAIGCSAVLFSWIGPMLDPFTHSIGLWVLTFDPFEMMIARIYNLPFAPWTRIENTVVTGSFVLSLLLAIAFYPVAEMLFQRFGASAYRKLMESRLAQWFIGIPPRSTQQQLQQS